MKYFFRFLPLILFLLAFSFCYGEEAAKKTAMEVYLALPDEPNEAQVAEFYSALKAESKVVDPATCDKKNRPHFMVQYESINREFVTSETQEQYGGEKYLESPGYDYIYHRKQKAHLFRPLTIQILLETEVDGDLELQMLRLQQLIDIYSGMLNAAKWRSIYDFPYESAEMAKHTARLEPHLKKYDAYSKLYEIADKNSVELSFDGEDKWKQLINMKAEMLPKNADVTPIEGLSYWKWLDKNFSDDEIFIKAFPSTEELLIEIENTRRKDFLKKYINPSFVDLSAFNLYLSKNGDNIAMALTCYRIAKRLGNFDDLSDREKKAFVSLIYCASGAGLKIRIPEAYKAVCFKYAENRKIMERIAEHNGGIKRELRLVEKGTTGNVTFCGAYELAGKGEETNFIDAVYPQIHALMSENDETGRSYGQYTSGIKSKSDIAYIHGATKFYSWNHVSSYFGFRQFEDHRPEVKVPLAFNYDVTPEGLQKLVTPESMKMFQKGSKGNVILDPKMFVETYIPVATYLVDKVDYAIYYQHYSGCSINGETGAMDNAFAFVVFSPAKDATVIEAKVGMIHKQHDYWFRRGFYHFFKTRPYYVEDLATDKEKQPIFDKAREQIDKILNTYDANKKSK